MWSARNSMGWRVPVLLFACFLHPRPALSQESPKIIQLADAGHTSEAPMVPGGIEGGPVFEVVEQEPNEFVGPPPLVESFDHIDMMESLEPQPHPRDAEDETATIPPGEMGPPVVLANDPCEQFDMEDEDWLDRNQLRVYKTVCGATAWFDGFFGGRRYDAATGQTFGRVSAGTFWDERDGWDTRVRFRGRFALPSMRERASLVIGRGDEEEYLEDRTTRGSDPLPAPPRTGQEDSTFIGLGFGRINSLTRALDFGVGLRLGSPIEPIVKIKYRRNWQLSDRDLLRLAPTVYWRSEEGFGATVGFDVDHVISSDMLFRWSNFANVSEDEEIDGVDWGSALYLFHALSQKRAMTYYIFTRGETKNEVEFKNVGLETRFRHRFLRDWLFVEYIGNVTWPREFQDERRKTNLGAGIRLEAYFGPAPQEWMAARQ